MIIQVRTKWRRVRPDAQLPVKLLPEQPGWYFYWRPKPDSAYFLQGHEMFWQSQAPQVVLETGLACEIQPGWFMKLEPVPNQSSRYFVQVLGGLVDSNYRDEIRVTLSIPQVGDWERLSLRPGDRIAYGLYQSIPTVAHEDTDLIAPTEVSKEEER